MSWSWVVRMLIILAVVLLVVAGTVVALRLTDPGAEEASEATPTPQETAQMPATPTPLVTPRTLPTPIPTPPPAPTPTPVETETAAPALAVGDPCSASLSAAIAAANESQSSFMVGRTDAAQLSATWGAMAARAQASAESLLAKSTDTYSVVRITGIDFQVGDCTLQSVSADGNEVVIETQEVWTYDADLSCTASDEEQTSRELVTYPGQRYTFSRDGEGWQMQDWVIGVVNIAPAWACT